MEPASLPSITLPADRFLICENCGISFVWTGWEQHRDAATPQQCPGCRHLFRLTRRQRGTVKWYDPRRGYGFITARDGSEVFVHRRALGRLRTLRRGDVVAYKLGHNEAGPHAISVERLSGRKRRRSTGRKGHRGRQTPSSSPSQ
ncbi:MAG: hypothetical protein D6775_02245 [Caldilineae bacterium]|nr:MAG: hypothetical protein D6775_02245 [Caldilineae bacterium]